MTKPELATLALDDAPEQSVFDLLAPIRSHYTSRTLRDQEAPLVVTQREARPDPCALPCVVEAIVTVDPEGRIPWRFNFDDLDMTNVGLCLRSSESLIEVTTDPLHDGPWRKRDRHGRLHLPQGILRSIACRPGDRLAVVRLHDRPEVVLVRADRLSIHTSPG